MGSRRRRLNSGTFGLACSGCVTEVFLVMKLPSKDFSVFFSAMSLMPPSKHGKLELEKTKSCSDHLNSRDRMIQTNDVLSNDPNEFMIFLSTQMNPI
mmetsp:Transcript_85929/g.166605  ORF Transcript_85929/g.166605 Transcript_85929/m.166605 type:complete len:97 (+) Transcript_85929:1661-1951(+)